MSRLHVELLLGVPVRDPAGRLVGRIEEIRGETSRDAFVVECFLVGTTAFADRLAARGVLRVVRHLLGVPNATIYRIPWQQLDLTNPARPRTTVAVDSLAHHPERRR